MELPSREATDEEVKAWVRTTVEAMDDTPRVSNWRYRALGMSMGQAIAEAPDDVKVVIRIPLGEARLVMDCARKRGVSRDGYLRRIIGTWMVAIEGYEPDDLPKMTGGGLIS